MAASIWLYVALNNKNIPQKYLKLKLRTIKLQASAGCDQQQKHMYHTPHKRRRCTINTNGIVKFLENFPESIRITSPSSCPLKTNIYRTQFSTRQVTWWYATGTIRNNTYQMLHIAYMWWLHWNCVKICSFAFCIVVFMLPTERTKLKQHFDYIYKMLSDNNRNENTTTLCSLFHCG